MLKFSSSMLCISKIHPFSLGNYLGTSIIIGNLMIKHLLLLLIQLGLKVEVTCDLYS